MGKCWLKSSLRILNSSLGLGGVTVIAYGVLMIRAWQTHEVDTADNSHDLTFPWVFHAFLGVGIALCAVTCLGHVAANTANYYYLSCYIIIVLLLLILETAVMAYIFLNPTWEKELPEDTLVRLDDLKEFMKSNDYIQKGFACLLLLLQGTCILLATILRIGKTNEIDSYESEDEYLEPTVPLLSRRRSALWSDADPNVV